MTGTRHFWARNGSFETTQMAHTLRSGSFQTPQTWEWQHHGFPWLSELGMFSSRVSLTPFLIGNNHRNPWLWHPAPLKKCVRHGNVVGMFTISQSHGLPWWMNHLLAHILGRPLRSTRVRGAKNGPKSAYAQMGVISKHIWFSPVDKPMIHTVDLLYTPAILYQEVKFHTRKSEYENDIKWSKTSCFMTKYVNLTISGVKVPHPLQIMPNIGWFFTRISAYPKHGLVGVQPFVHCYVYTKLDVIYWYVFL